MTDIRFEAGDRVITCAPDDPSDTSQFLSGWNRYLADCVGREATITNVGESRTKGDATITLCLLEIDVGKSKQWWYWDSDCLKPVVEENPELEQCFDSVFA